MGVEMFCWCLRVNVFLLDLLALSAIALKLTHLRVKEEL
jgi:hypothetical protein